jgi:gluconate 2-dehydrogenase gamma chain
MQQDRRGFLKTLGVLSATGGATAGLAKPPTPSPEVYVYLKAPEVEFLEAALARLIPADELGPGAKEAGVAVFIDRQLAGEFGTMAREYGLGPWREGTPQQGYQSRLTPREVYRAAIAETDERCLRLYGKKFAALSTAEQEEVLKALAEGAFTLGSAGAPLFFDLLWQNTQEGFFADPIHGGNRGKAGWRLVGFPGVAAVYTEQIEKHGVPYRAEPVSIADLQQGRAKVDAHGHPVHAPAAAPERGRP